MAATLVVRVVNAADRTLGALAQNFRVEDSLFRVDDPIGPRYGEW